MFVDFEKWHGCKNDFIVLWMEINQTKLLLPTVKRLSPQLCSRREGVGADGILVLVYSHSAPFPGELVIINQDGSEAKNCGNGLRCAALSIYKHFQEKGEDCSSFDLRVQEKTFGCQMLPQRKGLPYVQVNLGIPLLNEANDWHDKARELVRMTLQDLSLDSKLLNDLSTCTIGNRHLVFVTEEERRKDFLRLGEALQHAPFWDGINVTFATPLQGERPLDAAMQGQDVGDAYKIYVWERGVGETQACGSAACALASSLLASGLFSRSEWLSLLFSGGTLYVKQDEENGDAFLCGPGEYVFSGKLDL